MSEFMNESDIPEVSRLYAQVFAGPPWNEYTICKKGRFFGLDTEPEQVCGCGCRSRLTLAYPEDKTVGYITKEMNKRDARGVVIREDSEIIGFAWGYRCSPGELTREKYRTRQMRQAINKLLKYEVWLFYYSECGVRNDKRGRGLSNELAESLESAAAIINWPMVMRTNYQSPMVAVAEYLGMEQIMGPSVEVDRRNRIIRTTGDYVNGIKDTENEDRVLFVLDKYTY